MISLSRLAASSDSAPRPSVGRVRFELDFPPPMAVGIAISGVVVLVGAWAGGAAPAPAGGAVSPASLVGAAGYNAGSSWWKTTWHRTGAALVATALFFPTLVVGLGAVQALGLPQDGGGRRVLLQHPSEGQPPVQSRPARRHLQALA